MRTQQNFFESIVIILLWRNAIALSSRINTGISRSVTSMGIATSGETHISRRDLLKSVAIASAVLPTRKDNAYAATPSTETYTDPRGFSMQVPASWTFSKQTMPDRRQLKFWSDPEHLQECFIFVAYTPIRDDFTSINSFGSVDQVAQTSILPKGELAGQDVESKLLSAQAENEAYFFDYTQTVPNVQPATHVRVIFSLVKPTGGAGNVLVTITAQAPEALYEKYYKGLYDRVLSSFRKIS